jgi:hypothetical protein
MSWSHCATARSVCLLVHLHGQATIEFDAGCQQRGRRHELAQQVAYRIGVMASLEHRAPGGVEAHDLTADRRMLEDEALQGIVGKHGVQMQLSCFIKV